MTMSNSNPHYGIMCPKCRDVIYSLYRHDERYCSCSSCSIDGGTDYLRYGWTNDVKKENIKIIKRIPAKNFHDKTGLKYGRLSVIGLVRTRVYKRKKLDKKYNDRKTFWLCKCDCGKVIETVGYNLSTGTCKSCGCYAKEQQTKSGKLRARDLFAASFSRILSSYKKRAKKLNINFDLNEELFKKLILSKCYYCGKEFSNLGSSRVNGQLKHNGIDRIDNTKGYTVDNSVACCKMCNKMKNNLSLNEFYIHIKRINAMLIVKEQENTTSGNGA